MNTLKINRYDNLNQENEQNGFVEFESLSLEYLNGQKSYTSPEAKEQFEVSKKQENEKNRAEVNSIFDKMEAYAKAETQEGFKSTQEQQNRLKSDIFEKNQMSDRESSNILTFGEQMSANSEYGEYFEDYNATFDSHYGSRDDFVYRPNQALSAEQLNENLDNAKGQQRVATFTERVSTFAQALGFKKVA